MLKARSNTVELGNIYVFKGNEEDHRLTFKGFCDRVASLDELKTKRKRWQPCCTVTAVRNGLVLASESSSVGAAAGTPKTCWQGSTKSVVALIACPCPTLVAGRNTPTFVLGGEVKKSDFPTASTPSKTGQKVVVNRSKDLSHTSFSS